MSQTKQEILQILFDSLKIQAQRYLTLIEQIDVSHDNRKEYDKEIGDIYKLLEQMTNADIIYTVDDLNAQQETLTSLINSIQNKLDTNQFVGATGQDGVSITDVENQNGNLIITNSKGETFDLGAFQNDFNSLLNSPLNGDFFDLNSRTLRGGLTAKSTSYGSDDWNDEEYCRPGMSRRLMFGSHSNGIGDSTYYYLLTFTYAKVDATGNLTQFAVPYNGNKLYTRYRTSGSFSPWTQV